LITNMAKKLLCVDPKKCISCGACVSLAPDSFELDSKDIYATAVAKNPPKDSKENIDTAIETCPVDAIEWK